MEYININKLTKLIALLLVTATIVVFCGCSRGDITEESSDIVSEDISAAVIPALTARTAIELINTDKLVTEIFICNSLCDKNGAVGYHPAKDQEYAQFSAIELLLNSVYASNCTDINLFLSYPQNHDPAVKNQDGKTMVFNHLGSSFTDFVNTESVTVLHNENEPTAKINCKTVSGKEITLNAIWEEDCWKLINGIYSAYPQTNTDFTAKYVYSGKGSLKKLIGKTLIIELFISDEEATVTNAEEDAFHQKVQAAADKLSQQVYDGYGKELSFSYQRERFIHDQTLGTRPLDFDLMIAETGFGSLEGFAKSVAEVNKYDNYLFAVYINKDIQTSAGMYDNTENTECYIGERVLVGKNGTSEEIYGGILTLAGAYGYTDGVLDKFSEDLYKVYFPNGGLAVENLDNARISEVNAYNCGITEELKELYRIFIPQK